MQFDNFFLLIYRIYLKSGAEAGSREPEPVRKTGSGSSQKPRLRPAPATLEKILTFFIVKDQNMRPRF